TAILSDRVGRRPMILATALSYVVLSYPILLLMSRGTTTSALIGGLIFAASNSFFSGSMAATMVELFPTRTRYTGMAIAYNVGQALLGGTAPYIATVLIEITGNTLAPAFYLMLCAAIAGSAGLFIEPQHRSHLG